MTLKSIFSFRTTALFVFLVCMGVTSLQANTVGIRFFKGNWEEAKAKAARENKVIFVETYASYCAPCKMMERNVFTNAQVARFFNSNFINYKIDLQTIPGDVFKIEYDVQLLPDLIFIDGDGQVVHRERGAKNVSSLIAMGKDALKIKGKLVKSEQGTLAAEEEGFTFREMQTLYENGYQGPWFLQDYIYTLKERGIPYIEVLNEYLHDQRRSERVRKSETHMKMVLDFTEDMRTNAIDALVRERNLYEQRFGRNNVQAKLSNAIVQGASDAARVRDKKLLTKCLMVIKVANLPDPALLNFRVKTIYYSGTQDWKNYSAAVKERIKTGVALTPTFYENAAAELVRNTDNKGLLSKAKRWATESVEMKDAYFNNTTLAEVLLKMGKKKKARKIAQHAVWLAKRKNIDHGKAQRVLRATY